MTRQESFVARLRRYRERARIPLSDVAQCTRIRLDMLEALEKGDLSGWPRGLYARAWMRAYAEAVGLDGRETVEEFCRLFPEGDRRSDWIMVELGHVLDVGPGSERDALTSARRYGRRASDRLIPSAPPSLGDRVARAAHIVGKVRNMRDLPARLVESWRTLRPSRPIF